MSDTLNSEAEFPSQLLKGEDAEELNAKMEMVDCVRLETFVNHTCGQGICGGLNTAIFNHGGTVSRPPKRLDTAHVFHVVRLQCE